MARKYNGKKKAKMFKIIYTYIAAVVSASELQIYESCGNPDFNQDFRFCMDVAWYQLEECVASCTVDDPTCNADCSREYYDFHEKCPCRSKCPRGCPCPEYDCEKANSVLVRDSLLILTNRERMNLDESYDSS